MNILKKILAVVAVICIIVGAVGIGAYYNGYLDGFLGGVFDRFTRVDVPESDFHYELVEPEVSTHAYTIKNDDNLGLLDTYEKLFKETNAAFLWENEIIPGYGNWFEYPIDSVSEDEFNVRMKNAYMPEKYQSEYHPSYDAASIRAMAKGIIQRLTTPSQSISISFPGKTEMIVSYNETSEIECFNNIDVGTEGGEKFFSKEKLSLQSDNIEVGTILCGEEFMDLGPNFLAKVSADITCKKNRGSLKDVSWIPDEGETKRVEFLIWFCEWNQASYYLPLIQNIRVLE